MNTQISHKYWSTLVSAVFGSSSPMLPPFVQDGAVSESVDKADMLSNNFDSKPSKEYVDLPLTCHPSHSLISFAIWPTEVRRPLLEFDLYGVTYPLGRFPLFC